MANERTLEEILLEVADFQSKMASDPESVSDDEIRAFYGSELPGDELRELSMKRNPRSAPKNMRASVNAKLRRRLIYLEQAVHDVEYALEEVFNHAAPVPEGKREKRLNDVADALEQLKEKLGIQEREDNAFDRDFDIFAQLLSNRHPESGSEM